MSGPSSEGRPSDSSEPSATSSHTLHSRFSDSFDDNGEGSSSQRAGLLDTRNNGRSGNGTHESESGLSINPLRVESTEEQDFTHRRHRNQRSGGFLLDSTFPAKPSSRQQPHNNLIDERNTKRKRSIRRGHSHDENAHSGRLRIGNSDPLHSSPLSREIVIADRDVGDDGIRIDSTNGREQNHGDLRVAKTRQDAHEASPNARGKETDANQGMARTTIDPNQIVNMALNLSESRRRNLNAGQLLVPPPSSRRVTSAGQPPSGNFRNYGAGSSLRQYLNEQRRVSRNISPGTGRSSPSASRHMSASIPRSGSMSLQRQTFTFSDATLARRDKARACIELRIEYLRLLEFLPPLKPDATAPGNFIVTTNNMPGSPHAQLTRVPSHVNSRYELGRAYNPLQFIRNRRSRARERKTLDHEPEEFQDVERVRSWVNKIERESQQPGYRQQDRVSLPKYHEDHERKDDPSKPARHHMGWIFTNGELLADAHWLEQGENKSVLEDHYGRKIFPPTESQKHDFQQCASKEYPEKRRRSWVDGVSGLSSEPPTGDESDQSSERGRKRRLLPGFRAESPKHRKHGWRGSRPQSGSFSDSSDSESGSQKRRSKPRRAKDVNIGPLELQMRELIEKEAREAKMNSPDVKSPDTPDKWGGAFLHIPDSRPIRNSMETTEDQNGYTKGVAYQDLKVTPKRRTDLIISPDSLREPRSSFEDLDSTGPNTPIHPKYFPPIGADLSPSHSRSASLSRKPKRSKLDIFRSEESTKSHDPEPSAAGADRKRNSRQASEEVPEANGLGTAIFSAPGAVKSLLSHKKNDSVSSLNSPDKAPRKDNRDARDPGSAVTRFFKGVRHEGSKVGEFIFRRDRPAEDTDSESVSSHQSLKDSETDEGSSKSRRKPRPVPARSSTAATAGSITSTKNGRYHLDLPSFRSSNQVDVDQGYATDSQLPDHHITCQARARANSRSPRFERLAPPRMDLRAISATSSPDQSRSRSLSAGLERLNKTLARPGGAGQGGLPVTSLANPRLSDSPHRHRSTSRPKLEGKRHWSITDDSGNSLSRQTTNTIVTKSEIAGIRALLLCSGVKAREIARRAHMQRANGPPAFLTRAADAANAQLIPVSRKEEHVLAARILVRNLEASTQALHVSADEFGESTVKDITSLIANVKSRVESDLFARVRNSGDEAVRITSEVAGSAPLTIKQVNDEIDKMIRIRRRRTRWVRRTGWMLVEWVLIGVMWWLWFVVVALKLVKGILGAGVKVIRWFLWI
ncbi:hypothetical protein K469DRAFT_717301 [Zopfia rhizophila CBS 207.26]|uniref:Uncharacterized protein n=1 Tax=Zopfia rhizophila CBS 207.26 TaxID=1314779 RepID=A0A6A6ENG1_9PEZI|nr:hypothetical protein K469DRAFT_717301 [Zopfia rhizophila CBS 207.26]